MYTDEKSMQMDKDADKFGWIKSLGRAPPVGFELETNGFQFYALD